MVDGHLPVISPVVVAGGDTRPDPTPLCHVHGYRCRRRGDYAHHRERRADDCTIQSLSIVHGRHVGVCLLCSHVSHRCASPNWQPSPACWFLVDARTAWHNLCTHRPPGRCTSRMALDTPSSFHCSSRVRERG